MKNLGNPESVRLILGLAKSEMNDEDLSRYMKLAQQEAQSKFNSTYSDYFRVGAVGYAPERRFRLYFQPKDDTIDIVTVNGVVLASSEYTYSNGFLEINEDIRINYLDKVFIYYIPVQLDSLVNYIACKLILIGKVLNTADTEVYKGTMSDMNKQINTLVTDLSRKPVMIGWSEGLQFGGVY